MDERDRSKYPDLAYTTPAEGEKPFQFTSCMDVPAAVPVQKVRKHRHFGPLLAALLILLLCASAVICLLMKYALVIDRSSGLSVQIRKRGETETQVSESEGRDLSAFAGGADSAERNRYQWDGAKLDMTPGIRDSSVNYAQIYSICAPSVGCLCAEDEAGNESFGAAIVMTADGALITSTHVISEAETITVTLNGQSYAAYIVGLDYATDLAVLKIEAENLTTAQFSSGQEMQPGDWVAVVGNPVGQVVNIANGILSAVNPNFSYRGYTLEAMQVCKDLGDIASGSALVNSAGQVIGIVNMDMASQLTDSSGVSFAISMQSAKSVIDELLENGYVAGRPSSGLTVSELPAAYAAYYAYPSCLYISSVEEMSPAWEAGLRRGDLIMEANGQEVRSINDLYTVINGMHAGDLLTLMVYRGRDAAEITFALMEASGPVR